MFTVEKGLPRVSGKRPSSLVANLVNIKGGSMVSSYHDVDSNEVRSKIAASLAFKKGG